MKRIPHKWRELPIKKRLRIPKEYFKINRRDIEKIRKIKDSKNRLIESARLQYELFKDIHTDLTAWIAGYAADSSVRRIIGSSKELREMFIKPSIKDKRIEPSWQDIKRNIKIPDKIDKDVAEECGIHIGDGNLSVTKEKAGGQSYQYGVYGDLLNEFIYHKEFIQPLWKRIFNFEGFSLLIKNKNSIVSSLRSKAILEYKNKILGFPIGPKTSIKIVSEILHNKNLMERCIVGIIDTDFHINSDMKIIGSLTSLRIIKQITRHFDKIDFKYNLRKKDTKAIELRLRKDNSIEILENWGLHNQKHTSKYQLWKEFGIYLPYTSTEERLSVIEGKLDIDSLKKISEKRKKPRQKLKTLPVKIYS